MNAYVNMDSIFIFVISPYIDDNEFMKNVSFLCKSNLLNKRRKEINEFKCRSSLHKKLVSYCDTGLQSVQDAIEEPQDLSEIFKDLQEALFDEILLERSHMHHLHHHKILYKKHCTTQTILFFHNAYNIGKIDFESHRKMHYNVMLCSTYRMGYIQKKILKKHYPYAKALIY